MMSRSASESGLAELLRFAAAPTFAVMALISGAAGSSPLESFCGSGSPLTGMASMYTLMCVFHTGPWLNRSWLKLTAGWRGTSRLSRAD